MKLRYINIKGFGRFINREFFPEPGLNIFYGRNESGKSTLQYFIRGMLYGLKGGRKTRDGAPPPAKQYRPWMGQVYGGIMEYELDNGSKFTVTRNFERNTVSILDEHSNNVTARFPGGRETGAGFAEQHLGLSERCFERTSFIGQLDCTVDCEGKKILSEMLANMNQSGDEDISFRKAINALKEAQLFHVGSGRTTTRPLNVLESKLKEALAAEQSARALHESCLDIFPELEKLRQEEEQLNGQLASLMKTRDIVKENAEIKTLNDKYESLHRYLEKLTVINNEIHMKREKTAGILDKLGKIQAYEAFPPTESGNMAADYTRYQLLEKELEEVKELKADKAERLADAQKFLDRYGLFERDGIAIEKALDEILHPNAGLRTESGQPNRNFRPYKSRGAYLFAAGVIAAAYPAAVIIFREALGAAFPAALAAGAALILLAVVLIIRETYRMRKEKRKERFAASDRDGKRKRLDQWIREADAVSIQDFIGLINLYDNKKILAGELLAEKERLDLREKSLQLCVHELEEKIIERLRQANILSVSRRFTEEDIEKWKAGLERYHALLTMKQALENELGNSSQKMESLFREISILYGKNICRTEELDEALGFMRTQLEGRTREYPGDGLSLEQAEQEIESIEEKKRQNILRQNTLNTRLEGIPDGDMLQRAREKVIMLEEEIAQRIFLGKALDMAIEVLSEASVVVRRDYVPFINGQLSGILKAITGGKYDDIRADDSLLLRIPAGDASDWVLPEQLSSGTSDQVYFALRLAAVRLAENGRESLPLFLDEPFSQYDETRTRNAIAVLREESRNRQIFLFTCKKREVELAAEIFDNDCCPVIYLDSEASHE